MQGAKVSAAQGFLVPQPFAASPACKVQSRRQRRLTSRAHGNGSVEDSISERQAEARAWVADWRNGGSTASASAESNAGPPPKAAPKAEKVPAKPTDLQNGNGAGKFQPQESYEDGSVLFTSASLLAVDFEELLTP